MIISHKHRFIFIHIPKCAGSSITKALAPVLGKQDLILGVTPEGEKLHEENLKKGGLTKHSSASVIRQQIGPEIWNSYFKFSFVRNPWDLLVSRYHWSLKTQWDDEFGTIKKIREFEDFEEYLYSPLVRKLNCVDFVSDENGEIMVDYAGKSELINWEFRRICERAGIPVYLPRRDNRSNHEAYFNYYNPITRDLVGEWYSRDIRKFDYGFHNKIRYPGRKAGKNKFPQKKWLIIHGAHHKAGTNWFGRIFKKISAQFNWKYEIGNKTNPLPDADTDIFLHFQSNFDFPLLPPYVGTHLIRDPRDIIISGYFYHLWCKELWCNMPVAEYNGKSYQDVLKSLNQEDGILFEMTSPRGAFRNTASRMLNWNYNNQYILELKYEEILQDMENHFLQIFSHYGFNARESEIAMKVVDQCRFEKMAGRKQGSEKSNSHFRKGIAGDWKNHFTESHKKAFKESYPGLLETLGYEQNDLW